ncbi:MAG: anti-sigma factor [Nocardia sp.]|uniref:anti-sigma factor n=1 Tax=Nocardia sp. TaxID=1821 RepID=UPI0026102423|nr:anti-sigma factor [Nocardia sp.]MCU1647373.1 anti-sigma factor [Nocardia sp.]
MSIVERPEMELLELAYPYAMDAVTDLERDDIELRRARADRVTVAEFDATVSAVRESMAELSIIDSYPAPKELEGRLMRALDRVLQGPREGGEQRRSGGLAWFSRLEWLAAAAVLVVAIGMGFGLVAYRGTDRPAISAAMIDQQPDVSTRMIPVTTGGELEIHTSARLSAASVRFLQVPAPSAGSAYQVWLVPLGGKPRSAAIVDALSSGPLVTTFRSVDTLAVTVEPAGGSPQPTTTPIASLNLVT